LDHKLISDVLFQESSHLGIFKKVIFSSTEMSSSIIQVAYTEIIAGEIINEHIHESMEEVFLVLDGKCEFYVDGICHVLDTYSVIKIPPKTFHKIEAINDTKLFYIGVALSSDNY